MAHDIRRMCVRLADRANPHDRHEIVVIFFFFCLLFFSLFFAITFLSIFFSLRIYKERSISSRTLYSMKRLFTVRGNNIRLFIVATSVHFVLVRAGSNGPRGCARRAAYTINPGQLYRVRMRRVYVPVTSLRKLLLVVFARKEYTGVCGLARTASDRFILELSSRPTREKIKIIMKKSSGLCAALCSRADPG